MKLAVVASLVASAAAFAPASQKSSSSAMSAVSFEEKAGALPPIGYWDPLGLATTEAKFDEYRAVELKHGRVAMLAVVGFVVPEFYRFGFDIAPGLPCAEVPNGVAALSAIPSLGWAQMFFFIGAVDYWGILGDFEVGKPDLDPDTLKKRQTQELQNGRLAMLATLELLRHNSQNLVSPGFDGLDNLITGLPFLY
ncbi:hypothetical protein MPSEU_001044800 [Mayamaea pseudoterrestris]|nr:hypothetical protein MPSEU_001044800 [Mayamaea pseudoterrestris]